MASSFPGEIGMHMTVEIPGRPRAMGKFETQLLGIKPGEFLLIAVPVRGGVMMVQPGDMIKLRWMFEGQAFGCSSYILNVENNPASLAFVECPDNIPKRSLRRHNRITLVLPIQVFHGARPMQEQPDFRGVLRDLSEGGCLMRINGILEPGWKMTIQFKTPLDDQIRVVGQVIRTRQDGEAGWSGMLFSEFHEDSQSRLQKFLQFCSFHLAEE